MKKNTFNYREIGFFIAVIIITYACSAYFDLFEHIVGFVRLHENLQLDEFITVAIVLVVVLTIYAIRKWYEQASLNKVINKKKRAGKSPL